MNDFSWNNSSVGVSCDMLEMVVLDADFKTMLGR